MDPDLKDFLWFLALCFAGVSGIVLIVCMYA